MKNIRIKNFHFQRFFSAIPYIREIWRTAAVQRGPFYVVSAVLVMVDYSIMAEFKIFNENKSGKFYPVYTGTREFFDLAEAFKYCEIMNMGIEKSLKDLEVIL